MSFTHRASVPVVAPDSTFKMQFLNTTVDLRLEIQPAVKLSSVSGTLGAIVKVILILKVTVISLL